MDGADEPDAASGGGSDDDAFTAFVLARWNQLLRTAYLLTGDHGKAEDMVQTALMRTHRRWRRILREDAPEVYVRKVMVNLATAWWRRKRVQEHVTSELPDRPGPDQHAAFVEHDEIWSAVRELPARMRAVLVLRYFEDMTEAQVAEALGCSVGTVKSQTHRALARLREQLQASRDRGPEPRDDLGSPSPQSAKGKSSHRASRGSTPPRPPSTLRLGAVSDIAGPPAR